MHLIKVWDINFRNYKHNFRKFSFRRKKYKKVPRSSTTSFPIRPWVRSCAFHFPFLFRFRVLVLFILIVSTIVQTTAANILAWIIASQLTPHFYDLTTETNVVIVLLWEYYHSENDALVKKVICLLFFFVKTLKFLR